MTDLLIHDLDDALHARLQERARAHSRSVEQEAVEVLRCAMARSADGEESLPSDLGGGFLVDLATRLFGPENGVDLQLPSRRDDRPRPPPDFSGPEYDP